MTKFAPFILFSPVPNKNFNMLGVETPASYLGLSKINLLISDYSTSLIVGSLMNVQTVSIIDMVEITDYERYKFWKKYLNMGSKQKETLFPKNIFELISICKYYL